MSHNSWDSSDPTQDFSADQQNGQHPEHGQYQHGYEQGQNYGQTHYAQTQGNYSQHNPQYVYSGAGYSEDTGTHSKKRGTGTLVLTTAAIAALVGGGVGAGVTAFAGSGSGSSVTTTNTGTTIVNNTDSVNEITAAASKATPSVVTIGATSSSASGSGSGIILDDEGHILTNTHVVTLDGASANADIEVQLSDGTVRTASIVGTDPTSDLAVIKIDTSGLTITPATLGDSSNLNVGDTSIAIGAPLGLENTVTDGIISSLSRTIEIASSAASEEGSDSSDSSLGGQDSPFQFQMPGEQRQQSQSSSSTISINVLQTDAAVNPGNSGGALVNSKGEVIGVNVAIASAGSSTSSSSESGSIGVGFAIPINYAKRIAQDLIENGEASHGLLGASVATSPANDDSSQVFGDGAAVRDVTKGGAADQAGIKYSDVITAFNGQRVSEASELTAAVRETEPGSTVTVTIERNGKSQDLEVTIGDSAKS